MPRSPGRDVFADALGQENEAPASRLTRSSWLRASCATLKVGGGSRAAKPSKARAPRQAITVAVPKASVPRRRRRATNSAFFAARGPETTTVAARSGISRAMLDGQVANILVTFLAVLDFCGLQTVSREWNRKMTTADAWRSMCCSISSGAQLHMPMEYAAGWKTLFWRHLFPARKRWGCTAEVNGFNIVVHARFRPKRKQAGGALASSSKKGICMPLHQRLRLMRAGKIKKSDLLKHGAASDQAADLRSLMEAQELPADVIDALMEAKLLEELAGKCERSAAAAARGTATAGEIEETSSEERAQGRGGAGDEGNDSGTSDPPSTATFADVPRSGDAGGAAADAAAAAAQREGPTRRSRDVRCLAVQKRGVHMYVEGAGLRSFTFSGAYDGTASQEDVYIGAGRDAVLAALNGFNSCLLCYGQTGSGKTHTIFGTSEGGTTQLDDPHAPSAGVVLRAIDELVRGVAALEATHGVTTKLQLQYVTLYQEHFTDLLSGEPCKLRDEGNDRGSQQFVLAGALTYEFESVDQAAAALSKGERYKVYSSTLMNARSSRAHTILIITLDQLNPKTQMTSRSCVHIADLAGSEQVKKSGVVGQRFSEAVGINCSLLALKKVTTALVKQHSHVPFRESALTKILKGALGGASRTTVVVTCAKDDANGEESLSSLRFGEQCACITNRSELTSMSLGDALDSIQRAVSACERQMNSMRATGRTDSAQFAILQQRYQQLRLKQTTLQRAQL